MTTPGKIVMTDSGKRGVLSSGKTAVFDAGGDCAECCGGVSCEYCPGVTPASLSVVISDVEYCQCSNWLGAQSRKVESAISGGVNGTFTLGQVVGTPCQWQHVSASTGTYKYYTSADCTTGGGGLVTVVNRMVVFEVFADGYGLSVYYESTGIAPVYWLVGFNYRFTGDPDCPGSFGPLANQYTLCNQDGVDFGNNFYNGSATVEVA